MNKDQCPMCGQDRPARNLCEVLEDGIRAAAEMVAMATDSESAAAWASAAKSLAQAHTEYINA